LAVGKRRPANFARRDGCHGGSFNGCYRSDQPHSGSGFKIKLGCHVFRATGIIAYLEMGGTLENAQLMAAHDQALRPHGR
jgi:hypothetical protein